MQTTNTAPVPTSPVVHVRLHRGAGATTFVLANGVVVHYKRLPGAQTLAMTVVLQGLEAQEDDSNRGISLAAFSLLSPRLSLYTRVLAPTSQGLRVHFQGPRSRLGEALGTVTSIFGSPAIDPQGVVLWKERMRLALAKGENQPASVAARALDELMAHEETAGATGGARSGRMVTRADVDRLTPEAAVAWQQRMWSTRPIEVALAGDEPESTVLPEVFAALGTLPARAAPAAPPARGGEPPISPAPGRTRHVTGNVGPGDAVVLCAYGAPPLRDLASYRAMNLVVGLVRARLPDRVHEAGLLLKEGGLSVALRPGSASQTSPGVLVVSLEVHGEGEAAQSAANLVDVTLRELATGAAGIDADLLTRLARQKSDEAQRLLRDPAYWSSALCVAYAEGLDPRELVRAPETYTGLTPDQIGKVVSAYCPPERRFTVVVTSDRSLLTPAGQTMP